MLRSQFSAIFDNFRRKNWRFSQKPMLWSKFFRARKMSEIITYYLYIRTDSPIHPPRKMFSYFFTVPIQMYVTRVSRLYICMYVHTPKMSSWVYFGGLLEWKMLVCCLAILYILLSSGYILPFGIVCGNWVIFAILICCTKSSNPVCMQTYM
jgi:hypothetical protein